MTASTDLDDTLANIRARAEAATPGPWHRPHEHPGDPRDRCVTIGNYGWTCGGPNYPEYDVDSEQGWHDAEFIAHARTDIEVLLTLLDQVTADRDRLRDRERWFAANIPVADGGQYRNDWPGAIENLVHQRDEIQANRDALAHKVAEQRAVIARVREVLVEAERRTAASLSCDVTGNRFPSPITQTDLRAALDGADTTTTDGDAVHEGDTHA